MTYIFLVAGKGSRLHPLTLNYPKSLYKLDESTTVIKRMVGLIKKHDKNARIVMVTGFMRELIEKEVEDASFVYNPFFEITNSIASLWFARDHMDADQVTIINGDIVMSEKLVRDILCTPTDRPIVLFDSSIKKNGDYNVQTADNKVVVMSKELDEYHGEYAGVTKLDKISSRFLRENIETMVEQGHYDQWYENALVQMIFRENFALYYKDICDYTWTEVDNTGDLIYAKKISTETE